MINRFWDTDELTVDIVDTEYGRVWLFFTPDTDECISIEDEELKAFVQVLKESEE
jgi:hypothetical protein